MCLRVSQLEGVAEPATRQNSLKKRMTGNLFSQGYYVQSAREKKGALRDRTSDEMETAVSLTERSATKDLESPSRIDTTKAETSKGWLQHEIQMSRRAQRLMKAGAGGTCRIGDELRSGKATASCVATGEARLDGARPHEACNLWQSTSADWQGFAFFPFLFPCEVSGKIEADWAAIPRGGELFQQ